MKIYLSELEWGSKPYRTTILVENTKNDPPEKITIPVFPGIIFELNINWVGDQLHNYIPSDDDYYDCKFIDMAFNYIQKYKCKKIKVMNNYYNYPLKEIDCNIIQI